MRVALYLVAAYLIGSFPTAYLLGRWRGGVDLRQVGSGNVGGSNLRRTVGLWATVVVGVFDIAKGALPLWLGLRLGVGEVVAYTAGFVAVVGHNWPVWLGFRGGRGGACTLGILVVVFPLGVLWTLALMGVGAIAWGVAPFHLIGILTVPLLTAWIGGPAALTWLCVALGLLMVVKRLEANRHFAFPSKDGSGTGRRAGSAVLAARLLYDRDAM
jgi:glycerol-3-phosphate acyltransferase PlsY